MRRMRVVLFGFAAALVSAAAFADDLRVPQDFPTIQAAVDAADEGDRILVKAGLYSAGITVDVANLEIVGKGKVVIDALLVGDGVTVAAANVTLRRLIVRRAGQVGFDVQAADTRILDCRVEDASTGIGVAGDRFEIAGCTVRDVLAAGVSAQGDDGIVRDCSVRGSLASGIRVGGSRNAVLGNDARDSVERAFEVAGTDLVVGDDSARSSGIGIDIVASDASLFGNHVTTCGVGMLGFMGGGAISQNTLAGSQGDGIHLTSSDDVHVAGNRIRNAGGDGIELSGSSGVMVAGNDVRRSDVHGILLTALSTANTVTGNTVRDSGVDGIKESAGTTGNTIVHNDVK